MISAYNIILSDAIVATENAVMQSQHNALFAVELGEEQSECSIMLIEFLMESKGCAKGNGGKLAIMFCTDSVWIWCDPMAKFLSLVVHVAFWGQKCCHFDIGDVMTNWHFAKDVQNVDYLVKTTSKIN